MVADLLAGGDELAQRVRRRGGVASDDEERPLRVVRLQRIYDPLRVRGLRAVVEGERDDLLAGVHVSDEVTGQLDAPRLGEPEGAEADERQGDQGDGREAQRRPRA